jgi:hypothetical protein
LDAATVIEQHVMKAAALHDAYAERDCRSSGSNFLVVAGAAVRGVLTRRIATR